MVIYLCVFFISTLLLFISNKIENKYLKRIVVVISLLIPCILAGYRNVNIGTDTKTYKKFFLMCNNADNLIEYYNTCKFEKGYTLLSYIIYKTTGNFQILLFVMEILTIIPIYFGLKKYKKLEKKIWLSMFVFYTMFYNITFNILRQYVSVALLFYGFSCLLNSSNKKEEKQFFIMFILAYEFHKSAIMAIILYIIYRIIKKQNKKVIKIGDYYIEITKVITIVLITISLIGLFNIKIFTNFLVNITGLKNYTKYVENGVSGYRILPIKILPIVLLFIMTRKSFISENKYSWFYILNFSFNYLIFEILSTNNYYTARIGYIFQLFNIVSIPLLCSCFKTDETRKVMTTMTMIYLLSYWWYFYVYLGYNQTMPYVFFK